MTFLEETEEGQEITYRVSQKVHTLGVETVSKYSALKFVDKLPAEVDYVSAWLEDAAGNKISERIEGGVFCNIHFLPVHRNGIKQIPLIRLITDNAVMVEFQRAGDRQGSYQGRRYSDIHHQL